MKRSDKSYLKEAVRPVCDLLDKEEYKYKLYSPPEGQKLVLKNHGVSYFFTYLPDDGLFRFTVTVEMGFFGMFLRKTDFNVDWVSKTASKTITVSAEKTRTLFDAVLPYLPGYAAPLEVLEQTVKVRMAAHELKAALDEGGIPAAEKIIDKAFLAYSDLLLICRNSHYRHEYSGNAVYLLLRQIYRYSRP